MKDRTSPGRAALARDAALLRQRRLTGGVLVADTATNTVVTLIPLPGISYGGGGPLHACALAHELSIPTVVIPPELVQATGDEPLPEA